MRFLDTATYELYEEAELPGKGNPLPPYAILSHIWLQDGPEGVREVTYQDMRNSFLALKRRKLKPDGWDKLMRYCDRARKDGFDWAWMDTCCIDKTNVVELQEAINAMFRWYEESMICYVYLDDVDLEAAGCVENWDVVLSPTDAAREKLDNAFVQSMYFTRGWTLQELLAPRFSIFTDCKWQDIGTREVWTEKIHQATKIRPHDQRNFRECSLATKLSWAAGRQTTLEEDHAYSLLGLFGISMPLVYGEGKRAFHRFQSELVKTYNDLTILLWKDDSYVQGTSSLQEYSYLAPSISFFSQSENDVLLSYSKYSKHRRYQYGKPMLTNRGIQIEADLFVPQSSRDADVFVVMLPCSIQHGDEVPKDVGIYVTKISDSDYVRIAHDQIFTCADTSFDYDMLLDQREERKMIIRSERSSVQWLHRGKHNITIQCVDEKEVHATVIEISHPQNIFNFHHHHSLHEHFFKPPIQIVRHAVPLYKTSLSGGGLGENELLLLPEHGNASISITTPWCQEAKGIDSTKFMMSLLGSIKLQQTARAILFGVDTTTALEGQPGQPKTFPSQTFVELNNRGYIRVSLRPKPPKVPARLVRLEPEPQSGLKSMRAMIDPPRAWALQTQEYRLVVEYLGPAIGCNAFRDLAPGYESHWYYCSDPELAEKYSKGGHITHESP